MNLKGKYKIKLSIINNFNNENIYNITINNFKDLINKINLIKKIIIKYDNKNYKKCYQCKKYIHINDMSKPEGLNILICQECLQNIMDGNIELLTT